MKVRVTVSERRVVGQAASGARKKTFDSLEPSAYPSAGLVNGLSESPVFISPFFSGRGGGAFFKTSPGEDMIRAIRVAFVSAVCIILVACHLNETPIKYDCDCDVACLETNGEVSGMGWWSGTVKDPGGIPDAEDKAEGNCESAHEGDCGGQPMCDCDCWVAEPGG